MGAAGEWVTFWPAMNDRQDTIPETGAINRSYKRKESDLYFIKEGF